MQTVRMLGHEPVLRNRLPEESEGAHAAIVNLGDPALDPKALVAKLHDLGVRVIAHAGHKEKDLLTLGREAGVDLLASNSELTFKLENLLEQVILPE
jgi:hypothetical protein